MKLWTTQPLEVYQIIMDEDVYYCDPKKAFWLQDEYGFHEAYSWLVKQMTQRIGPSPKEGSYPIWAWHTINWKHKEPGIWHPWVRNNRGRMVYLELEIPDEKVLLNDHDAWHMILNQWLIPQDIDEDKVEIEEKYYESLDETDKRKYLRNSWERVFNISPPQKGYYYRGETIQATFWEIRKENIVRVKKYWGLGSLIYLKDKIRSFIWKITPW